MLPYDAAYEPSITAMAGRKIKKDSWTVTPPSRQSITLDLPPSCIDFCNFNPRSCVVGTYYLEPQPSSDTTPLLDTDGRIDTPVQDRRGSLTLFRFSATDEL